MTIRAILGPTNTGKTHFALERMLGHASGMIGFPLRLLARENYDRIVRIKGAGAVALVTGEEKIIPPHPRWWVCTVESMPLDRRVDFLAVDEIQLCADPERGHIFTDRLLHARGGQETLFLGAETIKPLLRRQVPGVEFISRPRLSSLTHVGARKLNRLPPRSVVVAFSAGEVYAMAEQVRRARGGAAVVLGALSPRTRNAQVGMYQAGEVDYIVATDAIGMGLNMDVDHVAFAALRKFDGRSPRALEAAELAQIAGRAGRHMNDGTFGTTADAPIIPEDVVAAMEAHRFPALKHLSWRNSDLRFATVAALLSSLERPPAAAGLIRARDADDQLALAALAGDAEVMALVRHPERVRLLWEVCQIPDFRKVMDESHPRLLGRIFRHLAGAEGRLPQDWLAETLARIDRTDGELDTIIARIAHIRTWTYVTHRSGWVLDPAHWQEKARAIEDRLSDALHQRLTSRFVDKRTAVLTRSLKEGGPLTAQLGEDGTVRVEGHVVGRLEGFSFHALAVGSGNAARTLNAAALKALKPTMARRLEELMADGAVAFTLDGRRLLWRGETVAGLETGKHPLTPRLVLPPDDLLEAAQRERLAAHLAGRLSLLICGPLAVLERLSSLPLDGAARGILHQLAEGLGSIPMAQALPLVRALSAADRQRLERAGLRFGRQYLYFSTLLKPAAQRIRAILWGLKGDDDPPTPPGERPAIQEAGRFPEGFLAAVGYGLAGDVALRLDIFERFTQAAQAEAAHGRTQPSPAMVQMLHLGKTAAQAAMTAVLAPPKPTAKRKPERRNPDSPFAVLARMDYSTLQASSKSRRGPRGNKPSGSP